MLLIAFFIFFCVACGEPQNTNVKTLTKDTAIVTVDKERQNRDKYMHHFFTRDKKRVIRFESYDVHQLAKMVTEVEATELLSYQRVLSDTFKQKLTLNYMSDSLEVARSIALIILKNYYHTPFRNATDDIRPWMEEQYKPHIQYVEDSVDMDSACINTYPLAYFFLRYCKYGPAENMSKADFIILSQAYAHIKSHPKLKNHPPIKKMLQKLATKKWDDDED